MTPENQKPEANALPAPTAVGSGDLLGIMAIKCKCMAFMLSHDLMAIQMNNAVFHSYIYLMATGIRISIQHKST